MRPRLAPPAGRSHSATRVTIAASASAGDGGRPKGFGAGRSAKQPNQNQQQGGQQISPPPTLPLQQQQQPLSTASSQPRSSPQRADSPTAAISVLSPSRANEEEQSRPAATAAAKATEAAAKTMLSAIAAESESAAAAPRPSSTSPSSPSSSASALSEQLARLRRQNEELARLALDLAADRRAAALRVADLTRRFGHLASNEEEAEEEVEETEEEEGEEEEDAAASSPSSPPTSLTFAPPIPSFDPSSEPPFDAFPWPPSEELLSQAAAAIRLEEESGASSSSSSSSSSSPRLLVVPAGGAPAGQPALLLYNASGGPLASGTEGGGGGGEGGSGTPLRLRVGVNGWVDSVEASAERLKIPPSNGSGEWWGVSLALPRLLGSVAAVARRGDVFDNNGGLDFSVPVASPFASPPVEDRGGVGGHGGDGSRLLRAALEASGAALLAARDAALDAAEAAERPGVEAAAERAAERAREEYEIDAAAAARGKAEALAAARRGIKQTGGGAPVAAAPPVAAALAVRGRWGWTSPPEAGGTATLLYCSSSASSSPLAGVSPSRIVRLHLGVDSWWQPKEAEGTPLSLGPSPSSVVVAMRRVDTSADSRDPLAAMAMASGDGGGNQQWWAAEEIPIDPLAARLDFVFSEAESAAVSSSVDPSKAPGLRWDNNDGLDFHTHVSGALEGEALVEAVLSATGLGGEAMKKTSSSSAASLDAAAAAAAEAARARAAAASARRRRTAQTLFTLPFPPRAGEPCSLYYDPSGSVLKGRTEVMAKGGWNRGRHPTCFAPTKMRPAVPGGGGGGWLRSETMLDVPLDAWSLDAFVSDAATGPGGTRGAFSDDAKGSQYHLPVISSSESPPSLRIAHVAVEAAPAAKVGGMADVVTALARAARDLGHDARIILPKFDCLDYSSLRDLKLDTSRDFWVGSTKVAVWNASLQGVPTVLLEPQDGSVWAGCIYGRNDDAARFNTFCQAASTLLRNHSPFGNNSPPDVVHAHDWQSAPLCFDNGGGVAPSVFTIHNLEFRADLISRAIAAAAVATTVSPTYAAEVAGHPAVAPHLSKLVGVRNGIDTAAWNPATDPLLPLPFDSANWRAGKAAAKAALRKRLGLSPSLSGSSSSGQQQQGQQHQQHQQHRAGDFDDVPVVGVVSRLTAQKGIALIKHAAWRTVERGAQFVLLGSAPDGRVQAEFDALARDLASAFPDIILVPSIFEPCGLSQIIAARCGSLPCVRRTGGLADTVHDCDDGPGSSAAAARLPPNGYSFESADAAGVDSALLRALDDWFDDPSKFDKLVDNAMGIDWSWAEPCLEYEELYWRATGSRV